MEAVQDCMTCRFLDSSDSRDQRRCRCSAGRSGVGYLLDETLPGDDRDDDPCYDRGGEGDSWAPGWFPKHRGDPVGDEPGDLEGDQADADPNRPGGNEIGAAASLRRGSSGQTMRSLGSCQKGAPEESAIGWKQTEGLMGARSDPKGRVAPGRASQRFCRCGFPSRFEVPRVIEYPYLGPGLDNPSTADTEGLVLDGRLIYFQFGCGGCHGLAGTGGAVAPELVGEVGSAGGFAEDVRDGPRNMPGYEPRVLSDEDLVRIHSYLRKADSKDG